MAPGRRPFKMLCGQHFLSAGTIYIQGLDVAKQVHAVRYLIGYCPLFDALLDVLTVREHRAWCRTSQSGAGAAS